MHTSTSASASTSTSTSIELPPERSDPSLLCQYNKKNSYAALLFFYVFCFARTHMGPALFSADCSAAIVVAAALGLGLGPYGPGPIINQ